MIFRFAGCELDAARHVFRRDGTERQLEPQVFDLLHLLVREPGALLSRDRLLAEIWGGRIVSEAAMDSRIAAARRAVGDDGRTQRVIRTVARRGIRLVCPVAAAETGSPEDAGAPAAAPAPGSREPSSSPAASGWADRQRVRFARSRDGAAIAYATTGNGPPLVRTGHWLTHLEQDWHSPLWRPLLEELGRSFSLTRYDQRGTGLSARTVERLDLEAMTDDLEAVADAAGLDRFPIFGASQGVPVAVNFAVRRPERVAALVLYGGFTCGRLLREDDQAEGEALITLIRTGWGRPGSAFLAAFATMFMPEATREQVDSFVAMQRASASPEAAVRLREAIDRFDVRDRLGAVRAPTLVIHARNEAVQPLAEGRRLAAGIPGAELLVLESNNHAPLPQDPAWSELIEAIRGFCGG